MLAIVALLASFAPRSKSRPVAWRALPVGPLVITFQERRLFRSRPQLASFLVSALVVLLAAAENPR